MMMMMMMMMLMLLMMMMMLLTMMMTMMRCPTSSRFGAKPTSLLCIYIWYVYMYIKKYICIYIRKSPWAP